MTAILNELIDQRLSGLTGSSTGKSTLLWEKELESGSQEIMEETFQVEDLDKYKFLYMETYFYDNETKKWNVSGEGTSFIPMQIIINNRDIYHGLLDFNIRYIDKNNLSVNFSKSYSYLTKNKIYGVE